MNSKIRSCYKLIGFWQTSNSSENYLVVLERNEKETKSTLSIIRLNGEDWVLIKEIINDDTSIYAIDGYTIGSNLFTVTESNGNEALEVMSSNLKEFTNPRLKEVQFKFVCDFNLTSEQSPKVNLPFAKLWSTVNKLMPSDWLFSPKFIRGMEVPEVIANTADGQAMLFSPDKGNTRLKQFSIQNALEPQASIYKGMRYVAFKRPKEKVYPFWTKSKTNPLSGDLIVSNMDGQEQNISNELHIGPIIQFMLIEDHDGKLWIFALRDAPVGTDVLAMVKKDSKWIVKARQSLDGDIWELSVEPGDRKWHLVYGVWENNKWSIQYQAWEIPR